MTRRYQPHRYSWRLPVKLALLGIAWAAILDLACPAPPEEIVYGPYARLEAAAPIRVTSLQFCTPQGKCETGTVAFAPVDVRVWLSVESADTNRAICIFIRGPVREDSSCFPHTRDNLSQRTVLFRHLTVGEWTFWATLGRSDGTTHTATPVTAHLQGDN